MKAIIFDMYGVILKDPDGRLMPFINEHFSELTERDVYPGWNKMNTGEAEPRDFWTGLGFSDPDAIEKLYLDSICADDEFFEILPELKARGYKLAVLSNDVSSWSLYIREKLDLDRHFDAVVISGDVALYKPMPEIYELVLERLGLEAGDCIFIDDRRHNLEAAAKLGMKSVLFERIPKQFAGTKIQNFNMLLDLL